MREWLRGHELVGADVVRAQVALALAAELDDPAAPRYARPRVVSELRALLAELEATGPEREDHALARRLLQDVLG